MNIKKYDIWLADLDPPYGTEAGKIRPVVVVQTDFLNEAHLSTIICIITTNVVRDSQLLRVHLRKGQLDKLSDVAVDQMRAIDNKRLVRRLGALTKEEAAALKEKIQIVLDL